MKKLLLLIGTIFLLTGCVNEVELENESLPDNTVENMSETVIQKPTNKPTTEEPTESYIEKIERDTAQSEIEYSIEKLNVSGNGDIGTYLVYENYLFYEYDYLPYIMSGGTDDIEEIVCSSELYMLNIDTGESRLIYSLRGINSSIVDIEYNGRYLIWTEYSGGELSVNAIDVTDNSQKFVLSGLMVDMSNIKLSDEYLFWIDNKPDNANYSVYRYDFETKNTVELIPTGVMFARFDVDLSQNIIAVCSYDESDAIIRGYDFEGNMVYYFDAPDDIMDVNCNSHGVVWSDKKELFFYDAKTEKTYNMGVVETYALIGDYIILNNGTEGVYSYKIGDVKQKCIINSPDKSMVGWNLNVNGDIYGKWQTPMAEIPKGQLDVIILNISENIK